MLAKEVKAKVSIQILLRIDIFLTTVSWSMLLETKKSVIEDAFLAKLYVLFLSALPNLTILCG